MIRPAAVLMLVVALLCSRLVSAQPPAGGEPKPTAPPEQQNKENDDLDRIPGSAPQTTTPDVIPESDRRASQRLYIENAVIPSMQRSELPVSSAQATAPGWQGRLFVDVRKEWRVGPRLSMVLSDRVNLRAENDLQFPSRQDVINDWREGYLSWEVFDRTYVDVGRINLKSGAALGFNPTDFFKTRAVVEPLSADPSVLREDRLGTAMLRMQRIWTEGAITVAIAPALSRPSPIYASTNLPSFDPSFDRTNAHARFLVKGSVNLASDLSPELLVYHEADRTRFGVNMTRGIGQKIVAYVEWTGGEQSSLIDEALADGRQTGVLPVELPSPMPEDSRRRFQQDLSVGGSLATPQKLSINIEYHFHQIGFVGPDWANWFSSGQGSASISPVARELWFIRGYALDHQEPVSRHSVFVRGDWVDAVVRHLELTSFVNMDLYDRSSLVQIAADYELSSRWTVGAQASANVGAARSDFGSLPQTGSFLFKVARYF